MKKLLDLIRHGKHENCTKCPWNPQKVANTAFGVSCEEHGIDWHIRKDAISMQVVQDPAGTTPANTGRLCAVHNSQNPTDKTAQHAYDLWNAAVSFDKAGEDEKYFKGHYWTNAIMHGANKELRKSKILNQARKSCTKILEEQIEILSPGVIIATGEIATKSLFEIGILKKTWSDFKHELNRGVYLETTKFAPGRSISIFCTYHTSNKPVNTHISHIYSIDIQYKLDERLEEIKHFPPIAGFLEKYPPNKTEGKGMRVLLLHWLDIGTAIRTAHEAYR